MPSSQTLSALQEKGFRTTFRGFDKNDVLAYLNALDNENRQHSAEQEEQIAQLQAQLDKMRSEQSAARACVEKLQSDLSAANQRAEAAEKSAAEVVARAAIKKISRLWWNGSSVAAICKNRSTSTKSRLLNTRR